MNESIFSNARYMNGLGFEILALTPIPKLYLFPPPPESILQQNFYIILATESLPCKFVITKTYLYNFDPLKPHFYIVKLGFTGVYIIFLISAQNIGCEYSLEPPQQGSSNEYPQSMFCEEI